jgi:hypothetical protein
LKLSTKVNLLTLMYGTNLPEQAGADSRCDVRAAANPTAAWYLSGGREPDAPERGEKNLIIMLSEGLPCMRVDDGVPPQGARVNSRCVPT